MPRVTLRRWAAAGVAVVLLCVVVGLQQPAQAGGPLLVGGTLGVDSLPFTWNTATPVSYHTDQGTLGTLNTAAADALTLAAFNVWQDVTTASISFNRAGALSMDITGSNHASFFNTFLDCQSASAITNAIVYDTDGTITEDIVGSGQSSMVIGFASAVCISTDNASFNRLTRGRAVLNGRFQDGAGAPNDLSANQFLQVFTHEFGHLIGLDHSQVNNEVSNQAAGDRTLDDLFGLPVMFPLLLSGSPARVDNSFPPLAPDDEAWVSELYPAAGFSTTFGHIEGQVFFSDGVTPVQGTNLIARLEDNGGTPENESRQFAYSSTSGYLFTGNPGQSVTCTDPNNPTPGTCTNVSPIPGGGSTPGSIFGSRDTSRIGFFEIPVKAGSYTLEVEAIDPRWTEGSGIGPLEDEAGEQFALPGTVPAPTSPFPVAVNTAVTRNITLIGTEPRFDSFESARLHWREPAPAWLRERRPPAFLVAA